MKRLLEYDPVTGMREIFHKDGDRITIQTTQDVQGVLDHNKRMLNEDNGHYRGADNHPVAAIPLIIVNKWRAELNGDDPFAKHNRKWLIAKLNDPDNKFLRLKGGTL